MTGWVLMEEKGLSSYGPRPRLARRQTANRPLRSRHGSGGRPAEALAAPPPWLMPALSATSGQRPLTQVLACAREDRTHPCRSQRSSPDHRLSSDRVATHHPRATLQVHGCTLRAPQRKRLAVPPRAPGRRLSSRRDTQPGPTPPRTVGLRVAASTENSSHPESYSCVLPLRPCLSLSLRPLTSDREAPRA